MGDIFTVREVINVSGSDLEVLFLSAVEFTVTFDEKLIFRLECSSRCRCRIRSTQIYVFDICSNAISEKNNLIHYYDYLTDF